MVTMGWRKIVLVGVLLALVIAAGWQSLSIINFRHQIEAPIRDYLDIRFWCPFGCDQPFHVGFANKTSDCIVFPSDYGLKVFVNQYGTWRPIGFSLRHLDLGPQIPPSSDSIKIAPKGGDDWLMSPDLSSVVGVRSWMRIRVVFQGTTCSQRNAAGESFADYADLNLGDLRGP